MAPKMFGFVTAFVVIAAAALITERAEAETHTVGDTTGWTNIVNSNTYSSWAANHTFKVGDTLVFQFTTGQHDVATLTKKAYDECNNTDILGVLKQGPASYSLNETGDYYFICAFPGHCSAGQKLSIKVTASPASPPTTTAPPPSATKSPLSPPTTTAPPPSAASSLASTFSTVFMSIAIALFCLFYCDSLFGAEAGEYTVGDELGWTIPPGGAATYEAWAAKHSLSVTDFINFEFKVGEQDLALVTKEDYDACNTDNPLLVFQEGGWFQFRHSDIYYLTCTFAGHCTKGQKIALYIAPTFSPSPSPSLHIQVKKYAAQHASAIKFVSKKG